MKQSKYITCLEVSCYKPEEYLFRISALERCLAVTMDSGDADPKLLCSSGMRWLQVSISSGALVNLESTG